MGYVKAIQLFLKLAGALADMVKNKQLIDAGEDKAINAVFAETYKKLHAAKLIREQNFTFDDDLNEL